MSDRYPWISDLLDTDAKALGTYLALLFLGTRYGYRKFDQKPEGEQIISGDEVEEIYAIYFDNKKDFQDALSAGRTFIDRAFENHDILYPTPRQALLDDLELRYLDRFGKAVRTYLKPYFIPEQFRKLAKQLLLDIKKGNCKPDLLYASGTKVVLAIREPKMFEYEFHIEFHTEDHLKDHLKKYDLTDDQISALLNSLRASGYMIEYYYRPSYHSYYIYYIFPAACLLDQNLSLLEPEAQELQAEPEAKPEVQAKLTKDILESITRDVLEDLGFKVSTNLMLETRSGGKIEVDVWAERNIGDYTFSIYCSCKNWNRKIDSSIINEEHGRVNNLRQLPQLKLIIAKELTKEAKETAKADGFFVIELGEKADAENSEEAYELIYEALNTLFTAIAANAPAKLIQKILEKRTRPAPGWDIS